MAGGKLTPRQKMINLMYLVFIAMLALNMSKEVLSAFGLMNEQFEAANVDAAKSNGDLYDALALKASEAPAQYGTAKKIAENVKSVSAGFITYIESLKSDLIKGVEKDENGKLPYEAMDKGAAIDEGWFEGDGYSKKGKEIVATIEKYKADMKAAFGGDANKYRSIVADMDKKFNLADIKDGEGVTKKYLEYHYQGFPSIASLTKLTALQNNVKVIESNVYNVALGKAALDATSMNKYKAIVVTDKSAFFSGEAVTGKVVLGRYDDATVPTRVSVSGGSVSMESGQAKFKVNAGGVGEQDIKGEFVFLEDGKEVKIPIEGNYVVVPRPNEATISADKMNSVYRGVENPMTVSFAGISDNNVTANATGSFRKGSKPGQYNWNVTSVSGTTAIVNVTGKLPDGTSVNSKKTFNVRPIPAPVPELRGKQGSSKGNKNDLASSTVNVAFPDFVFDVRVSVISFELYVPGNAAMVIQGNKFDGRAQAAIAKCRRGDVVTINNIKTKILGAEGYQTKGSTSFAWEIQ